jgi:hypothetical protein
MEIEKLAILSTAHLDPLTAEWLDAIDWSRSGPSGGTVTYGYFMFAHEENTVTDSPAHARSGEFPEELWAAFEHVRKSGCRYVFFDQDGDVVEGLPVFDW